MKLFLLKNIISQVSIIEPELEEEAKEDPTKEEPQQVISIMSTSVPIDIHFNKSEFIASRPFNRKQSVI
jgi:hypothetical protein